MWAADRRDRASRFRDATRDGCEDALTLIHAGVRDDHAAGAGDRARYLPGAEGCAATGRRSRTRWTTSGFEPRASTTGGGRVLVEFALRARGRTTGSRPAATRSRSRRPAAELPAPVRHRASIEARAAVEAWRAIAPSRRTIGSPPRSMPVRSTTVEGSPAGSPPSTPGRRAATTHGSSSSKRVAAGSPDGWRWSAGPAQPPRERPADQPQPEPLGVLAAGERVAAPRVRDDQRHRARQQRRDRLAGARSERRDQLAHRQRGEVHDRRRLAVVAALDRVDPLDRRRVERVAGEPVEAVGGKHRHPARGDTALERAARASAAPSRSIETTSRSSRAAETTRVDPGQVLARLDPSEAGSEHQLGDGPA